MTPDELRHTLQRLANHCHHLQQELQDHPLKAPRYSQTDSHQSHGGPRPPLDLTELQRVVEDTAPIITGWAKNLAANTTTPRLPTGQPLAVWCAWLSRHRHQLLQMDWADDAVTELHDLEHQLRHHIHPTDPQEVRLPDYATAEEIAKAYNITPRAVRKYCTTHHITAWTIDGKTQYKTTEYHQARQ